MSRDHVGVTLDHGDPARLADGTPRQVRAIKDGPLVKERRLGAVKILGDMLPLCGQRSLDLRQNSPAKPERPPRSSWIGKISRPRNRSRQIPGESADWLIRPASSSNSMLNRLRFAWARNQPRSAGACPSRNRVGTLTSQAAALKVVYHLV